MGNKLSRKQRRKIGRNARFAAEMAKSVFPAYSSDVARLSDYLRLNGWATPSKKGIWQGEPNPRNRTKWRDVASVHIKGVGPGGRMRFSADDSDPTVDDSYGPDEIPMLKCKGNGKVQTVKMNRKQIKDFLAGR